MEERRREMEKGQQALVSSAAGTKAGRQEKRISGHIGFDLCPEV